MSTSCEQHHPHRAAQGSIQDTVAMRSSGCHRSNAATLSPTRCGTHCSLVLSLSFFWCTSHYLSLSLSLSFSLSACQQVLELIAFIREQRVGKSDAWIPNEEALADVMRRFSERRATGGLSHDLNRTRLIWLAVASGVVAILAVVSLRAVWNRK